MCPSVAQQGRCTPRAQPGATAVHKEACPANCTVPCQRFSARSERRALGRLPQWCHRLHEVPSAPVQVQRAQCEHVLRTTLYCTVPNL